jgi:hypothetical protein
VDDGHARAGHKSLGASGSLNPEEGCVLGGVRLLLIKEFEFLSALDFFTRIQGFHRAIDQDVRLVRPARCDARLTCA